MARRVLNDADLADKRKDMGWTLLHCAVFEGREELVEWILSVAPEMIDQQTNDGETALDFAFKERHEKVVLQLFKLCPSQMDAIASDWTMDTGCTVLHLAAEQGMDAVVAHILAVKPQLINTVTGSGKTPLHCAANCKGNLTVVTRLLAASPELINAVDESGETALHVAARVGDIPVAGCLLAASPESIHAVDCTGKTALHIAAYFGHNAMAEYLLTARPDLISIRDRGGDTVLHAAARRGHKAMAKYLLALHPELIHAVSNPGWTVLYVAALSGHQEMVEYLLSVSPALIDAVSKYDETTPLHAAAFETHHSKLPIARALLAVKPELIFRKNKGGCSVLNYAANHCKFSKDLIEELWRLHPEALRASDDFGRTPFHVAVETGNDLAIEVLQWHLTWEEIKSVYDSQQEIYESQEINDFQEINDSQESNSIYDSHKGKSSCEERYRPVLETQCESLSLWLLPEVIGTVFEYLGFERAKRMAAPISES